MKTSKKLKALKLGDSSKVEVGQWVAAIGNPHGLRHTMTKGIISAVGRDVNDMNISSLLQTDAGINPGNSGGPLVNLKGEVVGVNQITLRGAEGLSFAIPINDVKRAVTDLLKFGEVRRAYIGVYFSSQTKDPILKGIVPKSPAQRAGLKVGDRVQEFGGRKIKNSLDVIKAVKKTPIDKKVQIKVLRKGREIELSITPSRAPVSKKTVA